MVWNENMCLEEIFEIDTFEIKIMNLEEKDLFGILISKQF